MGKRKRSSKHDDEFVGVILKKVKKLIKKRRTLSSSSDSEDAHRNSTPAQSPQPNTIVCDLGTSDEIPNVELETPPQGEMITEDDLLDPDILELLGSDPTQIKNFGINLHKDIASRWKHILVNGLQKEEKSTLLKEYLPAENCIYMKAPKLNVEIKSALSEINFKKDSFSEQKQNQMSSCLSAIGKALGLVLSHKDTIPQEIIKTLSDAGRLLCDTHYRESISRRFTILNSITKHKRDILKNSKIDEHLFGSDLSEHLKSSKAISQSASELRINYKPRQQAPPAQPSTSSARYQSNLNGRGAPRAPAAEPRVNPVHPRRQPPPPPPPPAAPPQPRYDNKARSSHYRQQNRRR